MRAAKIIDEIASRELVWLDESRNICCDHRLLSHITPHVDYWDLIDAVSHNRIKVDDGPVIDWIGVKEDYQA